MSNETLQPVVQPEAAATQQTNTVREVQPVVDILETKGRYHITAEVPGVRQEDITLRIEGDNLHLSARAAAGNPKVKRPWDVVQYKRAFHLGPQIDREQVDATLSHGVLRIGLAKVQEAQPRKIEVRVSEAAKN